VSLDLQGIYRQATLPGHTLREREMGLGDDWQRSGSGLYLPPKPRPRCSGRPTMIDLFCGLGGFSLGFIQAGFEAIAGLDNDPASLHTYLYNLGKPEALVHCATEADVEELCRDKRVGKHFRPGPEPLSLYFAESGKNPHCPEHEDWNVSHYFFGDCRLWTGARILELVGLERGEVDCVTGGPPCQGFSTAGKRDVMDPRNSLVFEFARLVCEIHPKMMVFENVPGILSMVTPQGIPVVDALCRILEDGDYGSFDALKKALLTSAGCGAALKGRKRGKKADQAEDDPEEEAPQLALWGAPLEDDE
jgi:DNA (cytosine-5)-methyltransferase 1